MTHPGLAVMLMVGVGLGAVLYYFFASTSEQIPQNNRRHRPENYNRTRWNSQNGDTRNRRPDQSCMICLDDAAKETAVRLIQCMHVFHKICIETWRTNGAGEARNLCPICRDKIVGLEELR